MEYYYFWFFLFAIAAYFIVTDDSVAKFVHYISRLLRFQYEKTKWWILHNPANPIVKYIMWRRAYKLAEELQKEIESKNK
jgi:hypothetical protein